MGSNPTTSTMSDNVKKEKPYLIKKKVIRKRFMNPNYDQDAICKCGHPYHRHFDGYEEPENQACGCKYCCCYTFKPKDD